MSLNSIPPFYFPTTVFFIDDSIDFLANLSLRLDSSLAFQLYDQPEAALEILNGEGNSSSPIERFFSRYLHTDYLTQSHHVIDINLDKVHREVYNEARFDRVSVVVVDYDMPSLNGLEFCRSIRNPGIKKILLTGKADEKIAVQAFNEGLIDRFILKQDANVSAILNQSIVELQYQFFRHAEYMLAEALSLGKHAFLRDPIFVAKFKEMCREHRIVEYYLCCDPEGMLMIDESGNGFLLLIPNDDELQGEYEIAIELGAPDELLELLRSNRVIAYFWQTGGHWTPECTSWRNFLYPANELHGRRWYYYALINNPPLHKLEKIIPYRKFLDEMDQVRWAGV